MLNDEFNKFRGLNPVKIFISGPPASGKTFYGNQLGHYYNIPHITVNDAVKLIAHLPGEWAEQIWAKIEEKKDQINEEHEKAMAKNKKL